MNTHQKIPHEHERVLVDGRPCFNQTHDNFDILRCEFKSMGLHCIYPFVSNMVLDDTSLLIIAYERERELLERVLSGHAFKHAEGNSEPVTIYYRNDFFYSRQALLVRICYINNLSAFEAYPDACWSDIKVKEVPDSFIMCSGHADRLDRMRAVIRNNLVKNDVHFTTAKQLDVFHRFLQDTAFRYPQAGKSRGKFIFYSMRNLVRLIYRKINLIQKERILEYEHK